jgi:hypothetical protein
MCHARFSETEIICVFGQDCTVDCTGNLHLFILTAFQIRGFRIRWSCLHSLPVGLSYHTDNLLSYPWKSQLVVGCRNTFGLHVQRCTAVLCVAGPLGNL